METLTVLGFIAAMAVLLFLVLRLARNYFLGAYRRHDEKLAEDYRKAVEKHQLSDMKMSTYPDPPIDKKFKSPALTKAIRKAVNETTYQLKGDNSTRAKEIDKASRSTGDFLSVPSQLVTGEDDGGSKLWGNYGDISNSYDGAGHGGSFGGGGASGSWGSDDSSSSSYSDSSSDSGGSDSSSSD